MSIPEDDLDWRRIDVTALITDAGIATVRLQDLDACRAWLVSESYSVDRLDLAVDNAGIRRQLDALFRWEEQFGYRLVDHGPALPALDALRDGFDFEIAPGGRHVLELHGADAFWRSHPEWFAIFMSIVCEHSRLHLFFGRRFFPLLPLRDGSKLTGATLGEDGIPHVGWQPIKGS
ncbi:MAG: hypothetical protein K2Y23_19540 [Cyanobacteria bacterium]|nr:hypothetical protein [Cyanobacteriota bacterium]